MDQRFRRSGCQKGSRPDILHRLLRVLSYLLCFFFLGEDRRFHHVWLDRSLNKLIFFESRNSKTWTINRTKKINSRVAEQQQAQCPTDSLKLVYIFISASEMFSQSLQGACMKRYCDLVRVTRLLTIHFDKMHCLFSYYVLTSLRRNVDLVSPSACCHRVFCF